MDRAEKAREIAAILDASGESMLAAWYRGQAAEYDYTDAASILGRKGGSVKSAKKAASSKENGKKGGRPKNKP